MESSDPQSQQLTLVVVILVVSLLAQTLLMAVMEPFSCRLLYVADRFTADGRDKYGPNFNPDRH